MLSILLVLVYFTIEKRGFLCHIFSHLCKMHCTVLYCSLVEVASETLIETNKKNPFFCVYIGWVLYNCTYLVHYVKYCSFSTENSQRTCIIFFKFIHSVC